MHCMMKNTSMAMTSKIWRAIATLSRAAMLRKKQLSGLTTAVRSRVVNLAKR